MGAKNEEWEILMSWKGFSWNFTRYFQFKKVYAFIHDMDRVKRIWYLTPMRAAKVQASLRIRAVSPEPSLLAHTSSESRGTFRQKTRSLAPLNGWTYTVKICHDGMLEDINSLDAAHIWRVRSYSTLHWSTNRNNISLVYLIQIILKNIIIFNCL